MKAVADGKAVLPRELMARGELPDVTLAMPNKPTQDAPRAAVLTPEPAKGTSSAPVSIDSELLTVPQPPNVRPPRSQAHSAAPRKQSAGMLVAVAVLCLVLGAGVMVAVMKLSGH